MGHRRREKHNGYVELGIEGLEQAIEIGRGGFSVVYRAWQPSFQRHVAVKVLAVNLDAAAVDRFARECAAIGSLQGHPNIVTVHGADRRTDGQPFIVMEHMGGGSLAQQLAEQPLGWATAVDIGVRLAGALECAHRAKILHRDVKPGNVLLSRFGDCKLGDFGIARIEGRGETKSGSVTASWEHAPPEVVDGRRPTPASDVYSLASTIFALIDGRPPFFRAPDENLVSLSARIVRDPIRRMGGSPPEAIERAIRVGLAKDPEQRPATAADFGRLLRAAQVQAGVTATPLPLDVDHADREITEPAPIANGQDRRPPPGPTIDADLPPQQGEDGEGPRRRRLRIGLVGGGALAVVAAVLAVTLKPDGGTDGGVASGPTSTTSAAAATVPPGDGNTTGSPPASSVTPSTAANSGERLGQDVPPTATDPCHTPGIANGAAWQLGRVEVRGRSFDTAYFCNLFSGGTGSLDFVLGGSYKLLRMTIGFADDSTATNHEVRFEIIADGREYLIDPPTLAFGDVQDLELDVTGVTQLQIKITELGPARGSGGSSRPALAAPTLIPA